MINRKQNKSLGFYLSSFFLLHVSTKESLKNINAISDRAFSILFHEYVHFLQDITTFYGLNNNHVTVEYLKYANNFAIKGPSKQFEVPIDPDPTNFDNVLLGTHIANLTYGDVESYNVKEILNYQLLALPILVPNSPIKEMVVVDVTFVDEIGKDQIFTFGAGCIMESMAYLLEQLTCKDYSPSPDIPYSAAELLAKHIYPEFGNNKLNVLALCDVSLGISNPGKHFILTIEDWRDKGILPVSPEKLYEEFSKLTFTLNGGGPVSENLFESMIPTVKLQLKAYFNDPHFNDLKDWIDAMIDAAAELRLRHPTFLMDIAKGNIRENPNFIQIFNELGTPLLTNENKEFGFYHRKGSTKQIDVGYFWAINQIQERFLGLTEPCALMDFCSQKESNTKVDDRCKINPWSRASDKNSCPYALLWRHWKLEGFEPVSKL